MKYTQQEKLQTLMLCEIFKALEIKDSFNSDLIYKAIQSDQYWALDWEYSDLGKVRISRSFLPKLTR